MARIRTIKPEFFTSLTIADLPLTARLTFIGLWTHVDDAGRCVDDPRLIKAAVWPLDDRTASDIELDLKLLSEASLITRYILTRKRYIAVTGWDEHQRINRPTPSKLPAPEQGDPLPPEPVTRDNGDSVSTHAQLTEDSPQERKGKEGNREQGTGNGESACASGGEPAAQTLPTSSRPDGRVSLQGLPDDFALNDGMRVWAQQTYPRVDVDHETQKFVLFFQGEGVRRRNWYAAWQKWIADANQHLLKFGPERTNVVPFAQPRPSTTDARVQAALDLGRQMQAEHDAAQAAAHKEAQ